MQKAGPNDSAILQNWSPPPKRLGPPSLVSGNFKKSEKSTAESCTMHRNVMSDGEF